jgi:hypothetical protein
MLQVAKGQIVGLNLAKDEKVKKVLDKHKIELKEEDATVGCYVCPECGHCTWLED